MRTGADPGPGCGDQSRADRCLAPLVNRGDVPSLAYAVVRNDHATLGAFGGAGPQTIFEIGSVTKVFTALLLADMAERGQVRLSDPASRYLPDGTGPVTLADLATHTSGLPRLPPGPLDRGPLAGPSTADCSLDSRRGRLGQRTP